MVKREMDKVNHGNVLFRHPVTQIVYSLAKKKKHTHTKKKQKKQCVVIAQ